MEEAAVVHANTARLATRPHVSASPVSHFSPLSDLRSERLPTPRHSNLLTNLL